MSAPEPSTAQVEMAMAWARTRPDGAAAILVAEIVRLRAITERQALLDEVHAAVLDVWEVPMVWPPEAGRALARLGAALAAADPVRLPEPEPPVPGEPMSDEALRAWIEATGRRCEHRIPLALPCQPCDRGQNPPRKAKR